MQSMPIYSKVAAILFVTWAASLITFFWAIMAIDASSNPTDLLPAVLLLLAPLGTMIAGFAFMAKVVSIHCPPTQQ